MNPTDPLLLGIDIGTSNIKAALATPEGVVVAQAQASYPTHHLGGGWVEQDPQDWWNGAVSVVRSLLQTVDSSRVVGIGVSGQGCGVTLIDAAGEVIRPALIWMDCRAAPQSEYLRQTCAEAVLRINGKQLSPYNADPKLLWLAQHEPVSVNAARYSLTATAYLNFRLTGAAVMNTSDASILYAFDLKRETWSPELLDAFGVPAHLYPPVVPCQTVIGSLTEPAATALGLPRATPVIAGGEDTSSAGLALGTVAHGQAFLSLGTAGTVYVTHEQVVSDPDLVTFLHVLPGLSLIGGSMVASGAALDWCRQLLHADLSLDQLTEIAATADAGSGGVVFLPYLSGEAQPINDGQARGVFFGLSFNTGTAQLVRATMEGVAYAIEHNLLAARRRGVHVDHIRAVGKPAQNALWCQIIADVTGTCVQVSPGNPGATLGNALLAASALRLTDQPIVRAADRQRRVFEPDSATHRRYAELFEVYRALYPALKPQFAQLSRAAMPRTQ